MDYVIVSRDKRVFVKIGQNGRPETCAESNAQHFEYSKAKNIVNSMPKTMQRFRFSVEAVPEIPPPKPVEDKIIASDGWEPSVELQSWTTRIVQASTLLRDARKRKTELTHELSNVDKQINNLRHEVRLGKPLNACLGYKKYKEWKGIEEKRGSIKDELFMVNEILNCNLNELDEKKAKNIISALKDRVFSIREED